MGPGTIMTQPIQTADYWDETVDGYIAGAEPFTALFCHDAVALAEIEPGTTLLDIATGPGALAVAAAEAGASVTAIDFSQGMIDRLLTRAGSHPIEARRMDGQALDLPSDHFDRVCSVFGIPLFPDWRAGLAEAARVLRPGGRAVIGVADNPYGFGPNQLLAQARLALWPDEPIDIGVPGMAALSDRDAFSTELERAGFGDIAMHQRSHDIVLPADILTNESPMIGSNPLIVGLDDTKRDAVIAEATRIAEQWRDADVIRMPSTAHLAVAVKRGS